MSRAIHFLAGLPRSGCTLLSNILAQNPRLDATTPGGILSAMTLVRNEWNRMVTFRASPNETGKERALSGMLNGYHSEGTAPVVIDRSLGWLAAIEMAEAVLQRKARVLVCVRDVRDVLATFELQWQNAPQMKEFVSKHDSYPQWETLEGRCAVWVSGQEPVGISYNQIKDAQTRGLTDRLHFIEFDALTRAPEVTLRGIYEFLEEPEFAHDFESIQQVVWETYSLYGVPELHSIPNRLRPIEPLWPSILGDVAAKYADQRIWP